MMTMYSAHAARLTCLAVLLIVALTWPPTARSQGAFPEGPEFQTTDTLQFPDKAAIASLADGSFVVVWNASDGHGTGIWGQRYEADGSALGDPMLINAFTTNFQSSPSVTALTDGGFEVVWESWTPNRVGIRGRRFDADGMPDGGDLVVNSRTDNHQYDPKVTTLADGGFVVVWESWDGFNVHGRRFDADGTALGDQFQVNVYSTGSQDEPAVAALADGGFVVAWEGAGVPATPRGIRGRRYDAGGLPTGGELQISANATVWHGEPSLAGLPDGGFVAAWQIDSRFGDDIRGRRFAADGSALTGDLLINSYTTGHQQWPSVTALENNGFVVTWTGLDASGQSSASFGVRGRRFAADGSALSSGFTIDDDPLYHQGRATVASRDNGGFVTAWQRTGPEPQFTGQLRGRRYAAPRFALVGLGGKCLDVENANPADGTAVNIYRCKDGDNQRWRMDITPLPQRIVGLEGKCLIPGPINDSGNPRAVIGACGPEDATFDRWQLVGGGPSSPAALVHVETGLCLDVETADSDDGTPVNLFPCHGRSNQVWRPAPEVCTHGSEGLCLNQERFRVDVEWTDFDGNTGSGKLVPVGSDDSGLLWFFERSNWEMLIKVLDGCAINDRFWVFAAATTTVEYTLTVTDTALGTVREYFNPLGNAAAATTDTNAFATCSASSAEVPETPVAKAQPLPLAHSGTSLETKGNCLETPNVLCLNDDRFSAEVEWRDPAGNVGLARRVETLASDSGMFWFFNENNWEMLIKVLDGCVATGRFWMLAAATTDVEYTLRVTDTETGDSREYFNPQGNASSALVDTFQTCP